jgi:hypothetical protein
VSDPRDAARLKDLDLEIAEANADRVTLEAAEAPDSGAIVTARSKLAALYAARHRFLGEQPDPDDVL